MYNVYNLNKSYLNKNCFCVVLPSCSRCCCQNGWDFTCCILSLEVMEAKDICNATAWETPRSNCGAKRSISQRRPGQIQLWHASGMKININTIDTYMIVQVYKFANHIISMIILVYNNHVCHGICMWAKTSLGTKYKYRVMLAFHDWSNTKEHSFPGFKASIQSSLEYNPP